MAHVFPGIAFTPQQNANFLQNLGRRRTAIAEFMKEDVSRSDVFILFDGHRLITSSQTMAWAELGYDAKRRSMPQTNLLYVYSLGNDVAAPVYYKQYLGSTPDVSAYPNILQECGIAHKNYTVIADKELASEEDFDELTRLDLQYVIPIKRGSRVVAERLPLNPGCYTDVFTDNDRAIQAFKIEKNGFNVFVFFDAQRYANELADVVTRANENNEGCDRTVQMEVLRQTPEMGTFTLRTNRLDLNSQQIYQAYKQRQAIEQFVKTYGVSMDFEASYVRDQASQEGWLFLNHLSTSIGMACLADMARLWEEEGISFEDLRQTLGRIMASKVNGQWSVSPIKNATQKLMNKLQFSIEDADLEALLPKEGT